MSFSDDELKAVYPRLYAFAIKRVVRGSPALFEEDKDRALDLTHDGIGKMLAARSQFQAGTSLFSWGCRIIQNLHINNYDREKRAPFDRMLEMDSPFVEASQDVADQEQSAILRDAVTAIGRLSKERRDVLLLSLVTDTYDEIGKATDTKTETVKTRLHRARHEVAEAIENGQSFGHVVVMVDNGIKTYTGCVEREIPAQSLCVTKPDELAKFWSQHLNQDIPVGRGIIWSVKHPK